MSARVFFLADCVDPQSPDGLTYRQQNAARAHAIPIGALVELETGERLRVLEHCRDCDQTPLYSLGLSENWDSSRPIRFPGISEESLTIVTCGKVKP